MSNIYTVDFCDYMTVYNGLLGSLEVKAESLEDAKQKAENDLCDYCGWGNYEINKIEVKNETI